VKELRQRDPRQHDERHLVYVRLQPCCIPGCHRPAEAAHLRMACPAIGKEMTGKGEKPHDKFTVPLCRHHHCDGPDAQHRSNERAWWAARGIDPWAIAVALWTASGGAARAAMEKPAHRLRPIKARKPREKRAKMPAGRRTIPGRRFDGSPIHSRTIAQ
jgi:hypothetical protein